MELVIHKDDEIIENVCVAELAVRLALLLGLLATIGLLMAIVALQCKLLAARSSEQQKAREPRGRNDGAPAPREGAQCARAEQGECTHAGDELRHG